MEGTKVAAGKWSLRKGVCPRAGASRKGNFSLSLLPSSLLWGSLSGILYTKVPMTPMTTFRLCVAKSKLNSSSKHTEPLDLCPTLVVFSLPPSFVWALRHTSYANSRHFARASIVLLPQSATQASAKSSSTYLLASRPKSSSVL